MSKEADKDILEPPGSQEARRRRRKSGLRIPSDNVPRSVPVTPITPMPVTESSRVAVRTAVPSMIDPNQHGEAPGFMPPHATAGVAGSDGLDERNPASPVGNGAQSARADSDGGIVEAVLDDPSVKLPPVDGNAPATYSLDMDSDDEPTGEQIQPKGPGFAVPSLDDEATEVTQATAFARMRPDAHPEPKRANRGPRPGASEPVDEDEFETRETREMPAVSLEELGLFERMLAESGGERSDAAPGRTRAERGAGKSASYLTDSGDSGDAIDIPIEEGELEDASEVASDASKQASPSPQRAATVALSDEDLEELIEPVEGLGDFFRNRSAARAARSRPPETSPEASQSMSGFGDGIDKDRDRDSGQDAVPAGSTIAQKKVRARVQWMPEPGVPAAVAALESSGMESPLDTPLEIGGRIGPHVSFDRTSEPGELLADELIEEVDDSDVEIDTSQARPSPPPAPRGGTANKKPPPSPSASGSLSGPTASPAAQARPGQVVESSKGPPRKKPWFEEIFDEDYLRTLPFLTPQATQAEALFVADALGVEPGGQLLDIGCGYGRHAMELAARGFVVVALDLSLPLLLRGADEAQRRGLNINFVHGDMRELSFEAQFDGAYCLFSTFGYFDDETNKKAVQGIARALRPGARLVIEVLNRDYLITELPTRVWWEGDGCVVLEEVDFNYFSSRIVSTRSVVFDDGRQLEQEISLRSYCLHEFGKLLHGAGFRILEVSGSMATRGRFFGTQSREIIVVAEKRKAQDGKDGNTSS